MIAMLKQQTHQPQCDGVLPDFGDLIARFGDDFDQAYPLAIDDHRHIAALDGWRDQRRKPPRRSRPFVWAQLTGAARRRAER